MPAAAIPADDKEPRRLAPQDDLVPVRLHRQHHPDGVDDEGCTPVMTIAPSAALTFVEPSFRQIVQVAAAAPPSSAEQDRRSDRISSSSVRSSAGPATARRSGRAACRVNAAPTHQKPRLQNSAREM